MLKDLKDFVMTKDFFPFEFKVSFEQFKDPRYPTVKGGIFSLIIYTIFIILFINKFCELGPGDAHIIDSRVDTSREENSKNNIQL